MKSAALQTAANIRLPQAGSDQLSSATVFCQSYVVGLDALCLGSSAKFGVVTGMKKQEARQNNFNGLLNAFDVASKISIDPNIIQNLRNSTLGNMRVPSK